MCCEWKMPTRSERFRTKKERKKKEPTFLVSIFYSDYVLTWCVRYIELIAPVSGKKKNVATRNFNSIRYTADILLLLDPLFSRNWPPQISLPSTPSSVSWPQEAQGFSGLQGPPCQGMHHMRGWLCRKTLPLTSPRPHPHPM